MFWSVIAVLTVASAFFALSPLWRTRAREGEREGRRVVDENDSAIAFYQSQFDEVERDIASGAIPSNQAESARVEAARRLLAANRRALGGHDSPPRRRLAAAILLAMLICGVSSLAYLKFGSPDQPDRPILARAQERKQNNQIDKAVAQIEKHLAQNPSDARGWTIIAPVYFKMGRMDDAINAYQRALLLKGDNPTLLTDYAEALIFKADGRVDSTARDALRRAAELDPNHQKNQYYSGLAALQAGDKAAAQEIWGRLIKQVGDNSPIAQGLRARMDDLARESETDGEALKTDLPKTAVEDGKKSVDSPAGAAIAQMPPEERAAAIQQMVANLAARLEQNGGDVEGWRRLIRSYVTLNERDKALAALASARRALAESKADVARIEALAQELGLEG